MRSVSLALALLVALAGSAAAEDREPVRLRLGTLAIDGSRYMVDIAALSADIAKRTHGRVRLDWAANGQLGDDAQMAALVARGELDGGGFGEAGLAALVPEMAAWRAPAVFASDADVDRAIAALDGDVRELFARRGVVFAMWADLGFAQPFATRPLASPIAMLDAAAAWRDRPLDGALASAIVDGSAPAWAVPPLYMLALPAAAPRAMSDLRYRYVVGGLVFAQAAWDRLAPRDQAIVREASRAWEPKLRASWRAESARALTALARAGVALRTASDADRAQLARWAARRPRPDDVTRPLAAKIARALAPP